MSLICIYGTFAKPGAWGSAIQNAFGAGARFVFRGAQIFAHGVTGGILSRLQGGSFSAGFKAAGLAKAITLGTNTLGGIFKNAEAGKIHGGQFLLVTGSGYLVNGKLGAINAAAGYFFNQVLSGRGLVRSTMGERCNDGCTVVSDGGVYVESSGTTMGQDGITFRHDSTPLDGNGNPNPVAENPPGYSQDSHMSIFPGDKTTTYYSGFPNHSQTEHRIWLPPQASYNDYSGGFDLTVYPEYHPTLPSQ